MELLSPSPGPFPSHPGPQTAMGKNAGDDLDPLAVHSRQSSSVPTSLICSPSVPSSGPSISWAGGFLWVPPVPGFLFQHPSHTATALAPHWLALPPSWEHLSVWAASEIPLCPTPAWGPRPPGCTGDAGWKESPRLRGSGVESFSGWWISCHLLP